MQFLTTGEIAKQLVVDRDAVSYAIRKLGIEPVQRAGQVRLFNSNIAEQVRDYLNQGRTDIRRPCDEEG